MTTTLEQLQAGQLAGTRHLKLACGLTEFPREILDLADTLEVLDLSGNALTVLPDDFARLRKLRILFASNNPFTELPPVVGQCPQLSMVGFKANSIRTVAEHALPPRLRWLIFTDNEIDALPPEIGRCSDLAYAGNPFGEALEAAALDDTPIAGIGWNDLRLHEPLGEGASGVIYRAELRTSASAARPVAVKLFKGAVTSDGLPDCEMAACMQSGDHPNLIAVAGKVKDHPANAHGLVMELIAPQYRNLAGPPNFESCTRDIYDAAARFKPADVVEMAYGIASAACHLHRRGVMHGDLYAHNILHDGQARVLLGDFGAASFYSTENRESGAALERLEVRAYGCLLEELTARCDWSDSLASAEVAAKLAGLRDSCLSEDVESRPLFEQIASELFALKAR
ncbi:MAG: Serine/threonine protein kinase [uncultured Paraburkholderia sp.]|nr:MAG: Serine/threonine protein kinase [uncultured Paraburkholderia sp.]CAH2931236.1 MAG: Serine/threonine protein kinase [uncultured Paraburkholderia sp.]CAH2932752.1 MAG: Serine/threonine protein kinase [uncultured Paraburkholderia sp.]